MAENMCIDSIAPLVSEDSLNEGAPLSISTIAADETPNGLCDQNSQRPDGVINEEVILDAEYMEGNYEAEETIVSNEIPDSFSLAPENPLGDHTLIEAQHDSLSEPTTESGIVTDVVDNQKSLDHDVNYNSLESSLRACSSIVRQSSRDLSGQKMADMFETLSSVEANTVMGDVVTQEIAALCEPNVEKGGDAADSHEMNKKITVKENKQDELPGLADGDRSTGCVQLLSNSLACTETSEMEMKIAVAKQSDSYLNSPEAKESKRLQDHEVLLEQASDSKRDDSFSFDHHNTSDGDTNKVWQPFSTPQTSAISGTVDGSQVVSSLTPKNKKRAQKISQGLNESSEPKRRRSTARKGSKKGDPPDEATLSKQFNREERPANSPTPTGSSLPTLNFSTSLPAAFQQPFTDLQQLQLRAQIFVYGSLIQGNAPDEACLISAFGGPNGGRSIWEKPWRKCLERIRSQISQTNMKSPVLQSSGKSTPDQRSKRKHNASSPGSAGKSDSSHAMNPTIPLSSPLLNMHISALDGSQVCGIPQAPIVDHNPLPPLCPLLSQTKNTGHATSWSSQPSLPSPWVASAQTSPWDPKISLSALPNMEPVKFIPVKDSSLISCSTANNSSAGLSLSNIAAFAISSDADVIGTNSALKSLGQMTRDSKSKKQKKVSVPDNLRQVASHSSESVLANPSDSILPASVKATPLSAANVSTSSTTALFSSGRVLTEDKDADRKDMSSEDALERVNEAKLHAEEAASCAEAAVSHSQHVWVQLDKQKNPGLIANLHSKMASAASAIAAAASVAKAAAAAAKLASEAALQAKLMVEKSLISSECVKAGFVNGMSLGEGENLVGVVTPASILKGENRANSSTSIIGAAKEAARQKIESALAASKHAENLDAIVKAAELAAEAVAQAGRVVSMGDSLSLSELVESGPEGYWKLSQGPPEQLMVSKFAKEVSFNNDGKASFSKMPEDGRLYSGASQHTEFGKSEISLAPGITSLETINAQRTILGHVSASIPNEDLTANEVVPPELVSEMKSTSLSLHQESGKTVESAADIHMEEGSFVEVFKEWGTVKAAWFAARVLDLKDEEVYVTYIEKQFSDGQYKEWITVSCEDNGAPIVRIAHPMTALPSDGGRKRRRSATGSRSWEVGDKVDAWMQDCWWEGVIIEKNGKDESSLTVKFPAQGETCVVKAWNLRPSLIWKDGAWVQWSSPNERVQSRHEDDMHTGKWQKLGSPWIDVKGEGKASESSGHVNLRVHDQSRLMGLSKHEKNFNVGNSTRDDAKVYENRMVHTGLQKEGSKIIFGIPKPGRKRKFMDVSKHIDAGGKTNVIESNVPHKTSRLPISREPHGWKSNNLRTESQQKTSKSKPKEASVTSAASDVDEDRKMDNAAGDGSASGTERLTVPESCSDADGAIDDSILISSLARPPGDPSSKRSALGKMKSEGASRGKLGLSHAKMVGVKGDKVASGTTQQEAPDATEPRRSSRRILPTSRLLEGLQSSSLSIAKVAWKVMSQKVLVFNPATFTSFNGWALGRKGPVSVSMFSPVATVLSVAISIGLHWKPCMFSGLYHVLWAKEKQGLPVAVKPELHNNLEKPLRIQF